MYEILYEENVLENGSSSEGNLSLSESSEVSTYKLLEQIYVSNCVLCITLLTMLLYQIVRGLFRYD